MTGLLRDSRDTRSTFCLKKAFVHRKLIAHNIEGEVAFTTDELSLCEYLGS